MHTPDANDEDPGACARRVRREHGWADAVPVVAWLEELGTRVIWSDDLHRLNPEVFAPGFDLYGDDGWTFRFQDGRLFTMLSRSLRSHPGRRRWTMAHEGGHIVLGHAMHFNAATARRGAEDVRCRQANVFARELLLPADAVLRFIRERLLPAAANGLVPGDIASLVTHFRVSWEPVLIRLEELGIQSRAVSECLLCLQHTPGARTRFSESALHEAERILAAHREPTGAVERAARDRSAARRIQTERPAGEAADDGDDVPF